MYKITLIKMLQIVHNDKNHETLSLDLSSKIRGKLRVGNS